MRCASGSRAAAGSDEQEVGGSRMTAYVVAVLSDIEVWHAVSGEVRDFKLSRVVGPYAVGLEGYHGLINKFCAA